jgi:hypothetical protein
MKNSNTLLTTGKPIALLLIALLFCFTTQAQTRSDKSVTINPMMVIVPNLDLVLTTFDVECYGTSTGKIVASWTGGTSPFRINLNGGPWIENVTSPYIFENLPAGPIQLILKMPAVPHCLIRDSDYAEPAFSC